MQVVRAGGLYPPQLLLWLSLFPGLPGATEGLPPHCSLPLALQPLLDFPNISQRLILLNTSLTLSSIFRFFMACPFSLWIKSMCLQETIGCSMSLSGSLHSSLLSVSSSSEYSDILTLGSYSFSHCVITRLYPSPPGWAAASHTTSLCSDLGF